MEGAALILLINDDKIKDSVNTQQVAPLNVDIILNLSFVPFISML
jgi:hypothetical protein